MKTIIFSGFLGAGKTTLIKKLISEGYKNQKLVLIENEFGEIGVDGGFLKESGIQINEINSGCICCSLVGDFTKALNEVVEKYVPEILFIEPSGVGKLSDVIKAVEGAIKSEIISITVVDAKKCKMYSKNFGEFFSNQIQFADAVILSHTQLASAEQLKASEKIIRELNPTCSLIATDWDKLSASVILQTITGKNSIDELIDGLIAEHKEHSHHHEHDHGEHCCCGEKEHEEECSCGHHHHDHHSGEHHHNHECCGHEHSHEHDKECSCGCNGHHEHHHEHEHGEGCTCGCNGHHDHHADEVFTSFGKETTNKYTCETITQILNGFDEMSVGMVLRAKGIVEGENGKWLHFDYVPGEVNVREGACDVIGKICVIGSDLNTKRIEELFNL